MGKPERQLRVHLMSQILKTPVEKQVSNQHSAPDWAVTLGKMLKLPGFGALGALSRTLEQIILERYASCSPRSPHCTLPLAEPSPHP